MTGVSLGLRTGSYGSFLRQQGTNGVVCAQNFIVVRKPAKMSLSGSREKERVIPYVLRQLFRRNVVMVILLITAFAFCMTGFFKVNRACPVCYLPVEQAIASMPSSPSTSPVHHLSYYHEAHPIKTEPHGGSDFGGYPSLKQRNDSFSVRESMTVHCGRKRVGIWRIIVVRNIPYTDARQNGKIPKLLLHRLFPHVRYSLWIDGKLQLVADPYQILERFLWRQNASFAISRHYSRFDVFEEAEANKAAGKYDNASIDYQIDFYRKEGLTPYSGAMLPMTSDVPEGCVIVMEHIPISNLFSCLWFNEVDWFTSRDQLSFSTVRDAIWAKVNWGIYMFLDCERQNFVIQAYHQDLLELMPPPTATMVRYPPPVVVREKRNARTSIVHYPPTTRGETLWESFKHPTDTFLPGMKMDENLTLTCWKSDEDPAPGNFSFQLNEENGGGYCIMKFELLKPCWKSWGESTNSFILKQMSLLASLLLSNTTNNASEKV
ncbi:hypothetical protein POM88_042658 [Heracleum sosnowskyi]|uniref:TOD1/MUCI70 glycosyltransferase-like domain-containing protein n=1 Tax=Heracleum sosnowskyi TaxID=360622 RepID=A0AAD8MBV9_9APIA|nr:hypothetical protein POM88_042658 [Heracleum sosnowskyi]